jgi:predicted glycosyltransferase
MTVRVLFWVQHLLGTGHVQRTLAIAAALAARGALPTVVLGGPPLPLRAAPGVEVLRLPALGAGPGGFTDLRDTQGAPVGEAVWQLRRERLLEIAEERRPAVVVTEMFPFGRRGFTAEVTALLDAVGDARKVVSVRDILVTKGDPARLVAMRDLVLARYDRVLVHGDPALLPFAATFPLADTLGERLIHTGLVVVATDRVPTPARPIESGGVLVSCGGGAVGRGLLRASLAARPLSALPTAPWLVITGAGASEADLLELADRAPSGVVIERHRADFTALLARCRLSISQAGYNTVAEALQAGARMVLVPFAAAGEDEQTIRARRLVELGRAAMVAERDLSPLALARALDRALAGADPGPCPFALDGAARAAVLILELA